jgi:hypothetical protein
MKVNREELLQSLLSVQPGVSVKEVTEQSNCVVFMDGAIVTFNDEISCRCKTHLKIEGAIEAAPLISLLSKLQEDEIEVDVSENKLRIVGKKRRAEMPMQETITLPVDAVEQPGKWLKLSEEFADAISLVEHCASKDDSLFNITCVHVHPKWIEASDRFQIARYKLDTGIEKSILVRRDSIKHITSMGVTRFCETENWIHFKNPLGLVMSCRRYVDDYPELTAILKMEGTPATLPKGIAQAADIASIFSAANVEDQVMVELRAGKMRLSGEGPSGKYTEVKKLNYQGEPMKFLIAPDLLSEISKRYNDCHISATKLKVNGNKFTYLTCLHPTED